MPDLLITFSFRPTSVAHIKTYKILKIGKERYQTVQLIGQPKIGKGHEEEGRHEDFPLKHRICSKNARLTFRTQKAE